MKIALLSNITIDPLEKIIAQQFEFIHKSSYNGYFQELSDPGSKINKDAFDIVLLHLDGSELLKNYIYEPSSWDNCSAVIQIELEMLFGAVEKYLNNSTCLFIMNTISTPPLHINHFLERNSSYSLVEIKERINRQISLFAQKFPNLLVMDWDSIVSFHGFNNLYDDRFWYLGRIKYTNFTFSVLGRELLSLLQAYKGALKKALVLDIDNTLWGGVIGEDGIGGIALSEEGLGKAYVDFQKALKALKNQGIILSLCSKNNADDVIDAFERHPLMFLSMKDFAAVRINWADKVTNIVAIANELNIGLDSMVFIDDNPAERSLVNSGLPEVVVPEFPSEPAELVAWFVHEVVFRYFPKISLTDEDIHKTEQYLANTERKKIAAKYDMDSFIENLDIKINIYVNDARFIERTAQLTQKTNQFNLTTKRYTNVEIETKSKSANEYIFNLEYTDRFGKEGIVGAAIVVAEQGSAFIDSFLLSCRIIGRKVEFDFLEKIIDFVKYKRNDVTAIFAKYRPTKKNGLTESFYENAGFSIKEKDIDGNVIYTRHIPDGLH
jgi:FkbH-like protein